MSTFTLMRLYLRYQNMPRLPVPCIGYAGMVYSSPLIDRQRYILRDDYGSVTRNSELAGTSNILCKKGAMGSYFFRRYSTSTVEDIKKAEKERQEKKSSFKLKTQETVKVMVISETGSISAMTLEEANKLAKKKGLNLVHIANPKDKPVRTEKEVYKMISRVADLRGDEEDTGKDGQDNKVEKNNKQQELKTVLMKSNIGDHDANAKINIMKKWINKGHRVRVQISQVGDKGSAEAVFKNIETQMAEVEGQIQQKIVKGNELRFYVGPPKQPKSKSSKSSHGSNVKDINSGGTDMEENDHEAPMDNRKVTSS